MEYKCNARSTNTLNFVLGKHNVHIGRNKLLRPVFNQLLCKSRYIYGLFTSFYKKKPLYYSQKFSFSTVSVGDILQNLNISVVEWSSCFVNSLLERCTFKSIPLTCKAVYLELGHDTSLDDSLAANVSLKCMFLPSLQSLGVAHSMLYTPSQPDDPGLGIISGRVLVYNNRKKTWEPRIWRVAEGYIVSYIEQDTTSSFPLSEGIFTHPYTLVDSKLQLSGICSIKSPFLSSFFGLYGSAANFERFEDATGILFSSYTSLCPLSS